MSGELATKPPGPRPFVEEFSKDLAPGHALDLACGDGRNAIWLAERGWQVTAVDRSPALPPHPNIEIHTADLERREFPITPQKWDLIIMSYYLQPDLYNAIVAGLKRGGRAIVIVLLAEPGRESARFRLQPGELERYFGRYASIETVAYREEWPEGAHPIAQIAVRRL